MIPSLKTPRTAMYLEVEILGRKCYLTREDLRIFYGLAGHTTGGEKSFSELPEDAFIVRVVWQRKRTVTLARERQADGVGRKLLKP